MSPLRVRLCLVGSASLFGLMAFLTRLASAQASAPQIAFVRFVVGLLGVVLIVAMRPARWRLTRPGLVIVRGLLGGASVLGLFVAIERLGAGLGTLISYTYPLWAMVFGAWWLKEPFARRTVLGFAIATAGLATVLAPGELVRAARGLHDASWVVGLAAAFASSVLSGAAVAAVRALRRTESPTAILAGFCLAGAVFCAGPALADWRPIGRDGWSMLVVIGVVALAAQLLFTYAMAFVAAGAGALVNQLTIVVAYALGVAVLGEPFAWHTGVGAALVLGGLAYASWTQSPPVARPGH